MPGSRWTAWRDTIAECGGNGVCHYCGVRRSRTGLFRTYGINVFWCMDAAACQERWRAKMVTKAFDLQYATLS